MDKETKIIEEVQKTLQAFENIKNIEANPFLFTRVKANLESRPAYRRKLSDLLARTKISYAFFVLLLALNIISVIFFVQGNQTTEIAREKFITSFAEEYSLVVDNDYLNNTIIKE
ncbi:MAG: hypothetical protein V1720_20520 [bacterium]